MTDLHTRFRTLDDTRVPDLWVTIERRAAGMTPVRATAGRPTAARGRVEDAVAGRTGRPLGVLVVIVLLAALAVGALAVGSGLLRLPAVVPVPAPSPVPTLNATPSVALAPTWNATGEMNIGRYLQTATVLPGGGVLVVGGRSDDATGPGQSLASAEGYDPARGSWAPSEPMAGRRSAHTATLLPDGKVLAAGGYNDWAALDSAEVYDIATGTWSVTGNMIEARGYHTATLLPDGRVLVAGGRSNNSSTGRALASAELYDPVTGSWSATGNMLAAHTFHAATLLPDGRVLVTGVGYRGYGLAPGASAELYDPRTGSWTAAGQMISAGDYQTATLLRDGKVLVSGGTDVALVGCCTVTGQALASAELYDPNTGSWTATGAMKEARTYHTSILLPNGEVLVTGGDRVAGGGTSTYSTDSGLASAELYDPTSRSWTAAVDLTGRRELHVGVLLGNGSVLVLGGSSGGQALRSAEFYGTN